MKTNNLKQQAIEAAYGEYWEIVKNNVDENGWIDGNDVNPFDLGLKTDEFHYGTTMWRPKSLKGIETNNGWISILSEADLPKDEKDIEFWILDDGEIIHAQFMHESKSWYDMFNLNLRYFPTHYQPITKPKPPIF